MKVNEMGGTRGTYGTEEMCIQDFGGEILVKEIIWKPSHRWEDNIKKDLQEVEWGNLEWVNLAQDRDKRRMLVNVIMNFRVP
jgi:hypothetical protein